MNKQRIYEISIPAVIGMFSIYYISTVYKTPWEAKIYSYGLVIGIVLCMLSLIIKNLVRSKSLQQSESETVKEDRGSQVKSKLPIILVALWVFLISIYYIGYFPATFLFLTITPWLLGFKKKSIVLVSSGMVVIIYVLFIGFLRLKLPMGIFF